MTDKEPVAEVITSVRGAGTVDNKESGTLPPDDATETAEVQEVHVDVNQPLIRVPSIMLATMGVLAVLVVAYLAYQLLPVLLLIFIAVLFATAIEPVVNW